MNLDLEKASPVAIQVAPGGDWQVEQVRRLATGDIRSHNTFEEPDAVQPEEADAKVEDSLVCARLPAQSITTIRMARFGS